MGFTELLLTAIALSMDAFAVSLCKGLSSKRVGVKQMALCGGWFGAFQGLMPLIGYLIGTTFSEYITAFDHWIAFVLLSIIGFNMVKEAFEKEEGCEDGCKIDENSASFGFKIMLTMAIATSIDACAVGVTFALLPDVNIWLAVLFIGLVTFILSAIGVKIGNVFGAKYRVPAQIAGGVMLVLIGLKILLEHLGVITF